MTGQPTVIDPALVWDPATNSAVAVGTVDKPALEGSFEVNGVKVRTAFELLKEEVAQYPPEEASKLTDVEPETIRELAKLAAGKGVFNLHGFGNGCYTNGVMFGHALATLAGLTGNVGVSGAGVGFPVHVGIAFNWSWLLMERSTNPAGVPTLVLPEVLKTGEFNGQPYPIKALHVSNSNPFSNTVRHNTWREEVLPKLDLLVVQDMVFTDTARWADIILPVPHWYEVEEIVAMFFAQHPYMQHSAKAVEPLYEARPDSDILRLMAEKMGVGDEFATSSDNELTDVLFDTPLGKELGLTYANLREKGVIKVPGLDVVFEGQKFGTPSGRLEFYVEKPHPRNDFGQSWDVDRERLPRWVPPTEAWPDNPLYGKYPLVVITPKSRFRVHGQWFGVPWLRELDPEPIVTMNPQDAGARGIANGDYVEVFNDRGHVVLKAVVSHGVRPGVLSIPKGWQRHQFKAGGYQELTSGSFDPVGVNASFYETLAEVRQWNEEV
jgi:molybdopterin-containing oxidoreductase family molybdopterin binding subunit